MSNRDYLKIVGYIELFLSAIGIIAGFVVLICLSAGAFGKVDGLTIFISWISYVAACFFVPAIGIAFVSIADLFDTSKVLFKKISELEETVKNKNVETSKIKETLDAVKNESASLTKKLHIDINETKTSEEENAKQIKHKTKNNKDFKIPDNIVRGKDTYDIGDHIILESTFTDEDIKVEKGMTGVIEDSQVSYGGRRYTVVLDDEEHTRVMIPGRFFE